MTTYAPEQFRKVLKIEQAAYIQTAIEHAKHAEPQHEGSRNPSGKVIFYVRTTHEALERYAQLKAEGWELDYNLPALTVAPQVPLSFVATAPAHIFETYLPLIAERAEQNYLKEVEVHNKHAQKLKERAEFIESEVKRREDERLAQLKADLAKEFDNRGRVQFITESDTQLHAR